MRFGKLNERDRGSELLDDRRQPIGGHHAGPQEGDYGGELVLALPWAEVRRVQPLRRHLVAETRGGRARWLPPMSPPLIRPSGPIRMKSPAFDCLEPDRKCVPVMFAGQCPPIGSNRV